MTRRSGHEPAQRPPQPVSSPLADADYARLAELRAGVRGYLAWAERSASEHGLTPAHVQLALAVRASGAAAGPTLTELAQTLLLRHHSVVGLVDRAEQAGLVQRVRDDVQHSRVHVQLTPHGSQLLEVISVEHLRWLADFGGDLGALWASFDQTVERHPAEPA
jgi:DNA-binding MarR family transcriptional regulator